MKKISLGNILIYFPILSLIAVYLFLTPNYSLTWDFPYHFTAGLYRLGEAKNPIYNTYAPYGIFAEIVPIAFSRVFPASWFPNSYLLYVVLTGSIGVIYFFRFLKEAFGKKIALLSTVTLLLMPRFVGHLHTNIKDVPTAAFFLITAYYFYQYLQKGKLKYALFSIFFEILAVNTKFNILQLFPVFILWIIFHYYAYAKKTKKGKKIIFQSIVFLASLIVIPFSVWILYCFRWLNQLASTYKDIYATLLLINPFSYTYAFKQFIVTTPIPILLFFPFGLFVLGKKIIKDYNEASFFFLLLFFYTLFKYPILRLPLIDDIRYFIEIYYPLSLAFVLGVNLFSKKFTPYVYTIVFIFLIYTLFIHHPYQINYFNFLAPAGKDGDFWAASYKETFAYVNSTAPKGAIVSAPLARELAAMYIRRDLAQGLNSRPPEESDIVLLLNRPSIYRLWNAENFYASHTPSKIISDPAGNPLLFIYFNH